MTQDSMTQLQIAFPKSSEDHRLQLVGINGSIFAILYAPLESEGPIHLYCEDWSLILLAPIKSESNIAISAKNLICFNEIESKEGIVNLHASNRLVKFSNLIKPSEKVYEISEGGSYSFDNDPGALLYHYRLFHNMIEGIRSESPHSLPEVQQMFITTLCTLAEKIKETTDPLDLSKVLEIWGISPETQTS